MGISPLTPIQHRQDPYSWQLFGDYGFVNGQISVAHRQTLICQLTILVSQLTAIDLSIDKYDLPIDKYHR